ncbi:MAG TPA: NADPH-dependent oxidoreductase [Candidatus Avibacteroides excrementipullorum]|nr:NADPH-dependent oxidoreductase [Candidatus Avibacteroides excrementipullorum]
MNSMKHRKTIRKYSDRPIPDDVMNELLETACRASTMGGMQLYSIIVTKDEETKKELSPLHFNQPMVMNAPAVLTFCADYHRFTRWCGLRNADAGYDNFESFYNAMIDALLAAQTFCNAAEEKGLGICFLGTTSYNPNEIIDVLHLPELVFPVTTITVGYPAEDPALQDRLPLQGVVHRDRYSDYTDEEIEDIYRYKESLEVNKGFVAENHKENLAQVFTDVRYRRDDNERSSQEMLKALKRQKFI